MRRTILLYIFVAIVIIFSFNKQAANINHLNYLKDIEGYLEDLSLGQAGVDRVKIKEGARYYRQLLKVMPANAYAYGNLGFCSFYLGDYKEAIAFYQKAIALDPGQYTFYADVGDICFLTKNFQVAVSFLNNSLGLIPDSETYYWRVAKSLKEAGKENFAAQFVRLAMRAKQDREKISEKLTDIRNLLKNKPAMTDVVFSGAMLQKYKPHWNPQIIGLVKTAK